VDLIPVPSGLSAYLLLIPLRGQEECRKQAGIGHWGRSAKKMRFFILSLLISSVIASAAPTVETADWQPACDGSTVEIIRDNGIVTSIHAIAFHSHIVTEWSIHFVSGNPVSVEYRETKKERYTDGDKAGELTGKQTLQRLSTWIPTQGKISIEDTALAKDLSDILAHAKK